MKKRKLIIVQINYSSNKNHSATILILFMVIAATMAATNVIFVVIIIKGRVYLFDYRIIYYVHWRVTETCRKEIQNTSSGWISHLLHRRVGEPRAPATKNSSTGNGKKKEITGENRSWQLPNTPTF